MNLKNLLLLILITSIITACHETNSDSIAFIDKVPVIDGKLDKSLKHLKERQFNYIWQFDNPKTDTIPVSYRLAHTSEYMYIHIEAEADSINFRPRGFVNGDGFKFLIAKPQNDSLTNEYYDMYFSASKDKSYWARKRIWEYNHKQNSGKAFSEQTKFEEYSNGKVNGYEALIAWKDILPYHSFFEDRLGFNLYFAKAIGDTITNGYAVVDDTGIFDEELPKRKFRDMHFEIPRDTDKDIFITRTSRKNVVEGNNINIEFVAMSKEVKILAPEISISANNKLIKSTTFELTSTKSFNRIRRQIITNDLDPGLYQIRVSLDNTTISEEEIMLLPDIDLQQIKNQISKNNLGVNKGAKHTLLFKLETYKKLLEELKPYESNSKILDIFSEGMEEFEMFMNGVDPYKKKYGPYRRAFLSKIDSTLQPYSIKLPEKYSPKSKYPLLVFLHGSAATDEGLLNLPRSGGNFIEIAPYGRDKYRAYVSDQSQKDIVEAIDDVSKYFSVDSSKIVIGGFSMGGYGSLRAYYENPELYKGVVVHAGRPDLANYWLGNGYPNFLDEKYLKPFINTKVFVYHGRKDGSLPVAKIEQMIDKMKNLNIDVTQAILDDKGHAYPDQITNALYFNWLTETIR